MQENKYIKNHNPEGVEYSLFLLFLIFLGVEKNCEFINKRVSFL